MTIAPLILALLCAPAAERPGGPVILDFTAPWCGPCQQMKPAVAQLEKSGYPIRAVDYDTSPLRRKYNVTAIPTFVVVDADGRELDRISGYRPAGDIAAMYREAKASLKPEPGPLDEADAEAEEARPAVEAEAPARANPHPWETVVRIKIENHIEHSIEFGSGTIIRSTPDETIILTCAHIFKLHNARKQYTPDKFPLKIEVHLSDGVQRQLSQKDTKGGYRAGVHMVERHEGEAVDYDFGRDVGLIRIRPGRRLPASPVVAADWKPRTGERMTTAGCSEGHDATVWSTQITKTLIQGVDGNPNYEAVECAFAPIQGRSGGGLYTLDGRLAGVCDFAEPTGNHGLYATPRTIHKFLDKNDLTVCYAPDAGRSRGRNAALVADRGTPSRRPSRPNPNVADTLRAQGPDEAPKTKITIPSPDDLHIPPVDDEGADVARLPRDSGRRTAWQDPATKGRSAANARAGRALPAEIVMPPTIDRDPFEEADLAPRGERKAKAAPSDEPKSRSAQAWKPAKP